MKRKELALQTGCNPETIRYYENIGLLPQPERTSNGYRHYSFADVKRLTFIIKCRELGFTTEDLKDILSLVDSDHFTCDQVQTIAETHLAQIRIKLEKLQTLEQELSTMIAKCTGDTTPKCAIIEELYEESVK
ncbi:MAG: helix-turn-helix domain-containing protein [Alphaproteobacteria bacterium]|nr:helix-turn-helix domain-containing protein [Alphaproteobacteria bacterium]